ncbi:hypothetical protein KAS41_02280 [Candidatus Parcubacteria bacterium]|nr:hypothetical protein [Candidatus Parcubacteria bacterium]
MKKKITLFVCLFLFAIANICHAGGSDIMWARHLDAFIEGLYIDHTFACVNDNGQNSCYAYHGGSGLSLGDYLSGTYGYGYAYKLKRCATHPAQCKVVWGIEGTCHQESNKMLYSSGKKVSQADGYWLTYLYFGHYGHFAFDWKWSNCKLVCNY